MKTFNTVITAIICFFIGHDNAETHLTENACFIMTKRCSRCKQPVGKFLWKIKHIPPPNSTPKQVNEWVDYCENKWQTLRNSCL